MSHYSAKACCVQCLDYYSHTEIEELVDKYTNIFMDKASQGYMNCMIRNANKVTELRKIMDELEDLGYSVQLTGTGIFVDWGSYNDAK